VRVRRLGRPVGACERRLRRQESARDVGIAVKDGPREPRAIDRETERTAYARVVERRRVDVELEFSERARRRREQPHVRHVAKLRDERRRDLREIDRARAHLQAERVRVGDEEQIEARRLRGTAKVTRVRAHDDARAAVPAIQEVRSRTDRRGIEGGVLQIRHAAQDVLRHDRAVLAVHEDLGDGVGIGLA